MLEALSLTAYCLISLEQEWGHLALPGYYLRDLICGPRLAAEAQPLPFSWRELVACFQVGGSAVGHDEETLLVLGGLTPEGVCRALLLLQAWTLHVGVGFAGAHSKEQVKHWGSYAL